MHSKEHTLEDNRIRTARGQLGEIFVNILIGLAVSIVMLNLGAALGVLSGRGAFAGMLSAGIIAFVTSAFGGTRIQGSGLTAPMSTVTAVIVAYASEQLPAEVAGISADHFVNIVLILTAMLLVLSGIMRLGRYISCVPNLVVSGFMCGIALIIWILQFQTLTGLGREAIEGSFVHNWAIALATFAIALMSPVLVRKISPKLAKFLPGTLVALLVVTAMTVWAGLPVGHLEFKTTIGSMDDLTAYLKGQIPTHINMDIFLLALPYAIKLAALCYIDTLLTSLIVDRMRGSRTRQNKELVAQGLASGLVGLAGGVPGAQSTVPSVLTVKEGATLRLAGMCAGLFVIMEMLLLSDLMGYIPQAVFAGILFKVGYDVFDFKPVLAYIRTLRRAAGKRKSLILGHKEMSILSGTALVTAFVDLVLAVGVFTFGFHVARRMFRKKVIFRDYVPG